jgi:hypothetical protein
MASRLILLLVALVASIAPARASPECRTIAEARAASPTKHLFYRLVGGVKCWSDTGGRARSASRARAPVPVPVGVPAVARPPPVQGAGPGWRRATGGRGALSA